MNSKALTSVALCSVALTILTTATPALAAGVTHNVGIQVKANGNHNRTAVTEIPKTMANFDFDFNNGSKGLTTVGSPNIVESTVFDGKEAVLNGNSGYSFNFDKSTRDKFKKQISIEAMFKYEGPAVGEHAIFSNLTEAGGLGLSLNGANIVFTAHDGTQNIVTKGIMSGRKWMHIVGVVDANKKTTSLYVNGQLVDEQKNDGQLKFSDDGTNDRFIVGGNSAKNESMEKGMVGRIKAARLYDSAITSEQAQSLSISAHKGMQLTLQKFTTQLVGATDAVDGHIYNLNLHTHQDKAGDIEQIQYDVTFDANKFDFVAADQTLGGNATTVQKMSNAQDKGKTTLQVTSKARFSTKEMRDYRATRLARIKLRAKAVDGQDTKAKIAITNASATFANQPVKSDFDIKQEQNVTIRAKDTADLNRDGLIGVGDISLASADKKAAIAKKSEIHPYKHVIVLTTDGGGNPWDPKGMYYAKDENTVPTWETSPEILAKRKNKYTIDLFNKQFAMSTTAQAVQPTISAQNYSSMIHGIPWGTMDESYKMTNTSAKQYYFDDFGKAQAKYPSVFKVLQKEAPTRNLAAFSEWAPFLNGIMEPDAAIEKENPGAFKSFDDVADYVGSDQFKDTSLVYMQSDQMDIEGHARGWYNDNYWDHYARYDSLFKTLMDKLEATGHIHDTLVIANADHGGALRRHGGPYTKDPSNYNIFLALGGETVDAGRRLKGGSNTDISSLILNALQIKQPASMVGKVFDSSAFLDQTELVKKHRQVESINLKNSQNKFDLQFKSSGNRQIRTIETRIDLAGQVIDKVTVPVGAKVLRQDVENGILKLTLSFDKQPATDVATVTLKAGKARSAAKVTIKQAMIGTDKGAEVLPDITTDATAKQPGPSKPAPKPEPGKPVPSIPGNGGTVIAPTTPGNSATIKPAKPAKPNTGTGAAESESHKKKPAKKNKLKGKIVYAQKKVGFYKKAKFTKKNRYKFFAAKSQNKWAQFKIVTKKGNRYQVKDINKGSKTYGKTGYITTSRKYVTSADYTKKPIKVKVINAKGLSAYSHKTLKGKHTTYKRGTMLKIKKLVKSKGKLRLQLKNGKYITVDKHMIHAYFAK
ncbi:LamG-like jellyroll fold domain-containing protein [Lactiplantibacillus dongliensis]|uniref:LamG-like jellyroll fold domain-containing protein n=1 Tax=Lactiplantibacillus dongliensis TaxID=2559919 RepID=A0ABW1RAL9_9LACO